MENGVRINKKMNSISKLGIGPMSSEIIESVFRFSEKYNEKLMLIASKNQIDWDGGYVNGWTTSQYMDFIGKMKEKYSNAKVYICRDHCGPGFKNNDLEDVYKTIDADLENGFDLIHIDFCHFRGGHQEKLEESKKAIEYIHQKDSNTLIEVGTDENLGEFLTDMNRIRGDMDYFSKIKNIVFYVCQTGSLIKEINQRGGFNKDFIAELKTIAEEYNFSLKEHNADYLSADKIRLRQGLMGALNIAPQYGVIQTQLTIEKCLIYGIDFSEWLEESYRSQKWKKWLDNNTADNKFLCSVIAGHYNFNTDSYKKIVEQINEMEDFKESVILSCMNNFKMYLDNL